MGYGGVILDGSDDLVSKLGVMACKLVCKGGKDILELLLVEVISGAEKACTKESLIVSNF